MNVLTRAQFGLRESRANGGRIAPLKASLQVVHHVADLVLVPNPCLFLVTPDYVSFGSDNRWSVRLRFFPNASLLLRRWVGHSALDPEFALRVHFESD